MKQLNSLILILFTLFFCASQMDAQTRRTNKRANTSKAKINSQFQNNGNMAVNPSQTNKTRVPSGPCAPFIDSEYYGVGVYSGSTELDMMVSGSYTVPTGGSVTDVNIFGPFGFSVTFTNGVVVGYTENPGSGLSLSEGDKITVTGGVPKEAVAYFDANFGTATARPVYFGISSPLNLPGGNAVKSIKINPGCHLTDIPGNKKSYSSISSLVTYTATLNSNPNFNNLNFNNP